jgi:hypothetical protein
MNKLTSFCFLLVFLSSCSAILISKRYSPIVDDKWNKLKNGPYAYSLIEDSSLIEITNTPIRKLVLFGPVLLPFIPISVNKYKNSFFFDLHLATNDTNQIKPPIIHLINPVTNEAFEPIKVSSVNFALVKELKLYHHEFVSDAHYRRNETYFYQFDLKDKVPILYIKMDSIGRNHEYQESIKYELKNYVKYKPIIIPWPS